MRQTLNCVLGYGSDSDRTWLEGAHGLKAEIENSHTWAQRESNKSAEPYVSPACWMVLRGRWVGSCDRRRQGESIPRQVGSEEQEAPEPWRVRRGPGLGRVHQVEEHSEREGFEGKRKRKIIWWVYRSPWSGCVSLWLGHGKQVISGRSEPKTKYTGSCRRVLMGSKGAAWELERKVSL